MTDRGRDCWARRDDCEPRDAKPRNANRLSSPFLARFAILAAPNGATQTTRITLVDRETTDDE